MKIILNGANGKVGRELLRLIEERRDETECVAAVDAYGSEKGFFSSLFGFCGEADALIDFSHPSLTEKLLRYARARSIPLVIATTGQNESERAMISRASAHIPIFHSANMSIGIAVFIKLARRIAGAFPDADIEIVEAHHRDKADSPSGTALMIADAVREERRIVTMEESELRFGRYGQSKRKKGEIGIHSIRGGSTVGVHELIAISQNQTVTLRHEAHSRALYAEGALAAAHFLLGKSAGLYNMYDMLSD